MELHEHWMARAIDLARQARERGDHPFGALLVVDRRVVASARNAVNTESDVTQHAELRLVSKASKTVDQETLSRCTLYTSTEPCAMCSGAIYWAGIPKVVYGFPAASLAAMTDGAFGHPFELEGPVLEPEARKVHEGFW